jgi:flagellin FlaB
VKALLTIRKRRDLLKQKRGMVGIEAAIVLIAFVIVAAAFSFMVVNMGLFATQRGKDTIQQGITEIGSPLLTDGDIYLRADSGKVDAIVVPVKTMGTTSVPMDQSASEVLLRVENHTAIADCYTGVAPDNSTDNPYTNTFSSLVTALQNQTGNGTYCRLFIGNSNNNTSLDSGEKGFLIFYLNGTDQAVENEHVYFEIRPEKGVPLSVEIIVPSSLVDGWQTSGG